MMNEGFHNRDGLIWYDGAMIDWRDASLHVLTHALHYASCVFEGERVYAQNIFKLREHTDRLINSANILGYQIPYTADEIDAACIEACEANGIVDGYVRPVAWRGSETMGVSAQETTIHLAIAVWTWPSYFSPEAREKGISLKTSPWRHPPPETAPVHAKAAGLYMICTMSKHDAENDGFDDALMLDRRGNVVEGTGANFFMITKNGVINTPPPDCFLNGITRQTVIKLAEDRGYEIVERHIKPEELKGAHEIFVTGTAAEVTPVGKIDNLQFSVGEITKTLRSDYENLVGHSKATTASD